MTHTDLNCCLICPTLDEVDGGRRNRPFPMDATWNCITFPMKSAPNLTFSLAEQSRNANGKSTASSRRWPQMAMRAPKSANSSLDLNFTWISVQLTSSLDELTHRHWLLNPCSICSNRLRATVSPSWNWAPKHKSQFTCISLPLWFNQRHWWITKWANTSPNTLINQFQSTG